MTTDGGHLRGDRLDGVRRADAAAALRCICYWAHRGELMGRMALPGECRGTLSLATFLPLILFDLLAGFLVAFRVLMVWVYDRTGSLLLAMLMHVSLTASIRILSPVPNMGVSLLIYDFVLAVALWAIVAAVAVAYRRPIAHQPLPQGIA